MSIFAGVVAKRAGEIPPDLCDQLRRNITRHDDDLVHEVRAPGGYFVKVDLGAFGAPGLRADAGGAVSLLAGEPLLGGRTGSDRAADLDALHQEWLRSDWRPLTRCRGTFCAAHYNPMRRELLLVVDKLGVRPIFVCIERDLVVFSTALRVIEGLRALRKVMDLRGVTETAAFGFPLAARTAYANVRVLREGELLRFGDKGVESVDYWRWDERPPVAESIDDLADEAYARFREGVRLRLRGDRHPVAFLSGGLDSRCIVASLVAEGCSARTVNYAPAGTQDRVFGELAAQALGTTHLELDRDAIGGDVYRKQAIAEWLRLAPGAPSLVLWSGDGGSVGVGHVYLNEDMVALACAGRMDAAIDRFLDHNQIGLATRLLSARVVDELRRIPRQGVREEVERLRCPDLGRRLHLFLMFNDQRRHMSKHFENLDTDRFEFHLPFFDADFLEPILTAPVTPFLRHSFYAKWLERFPPPARSVPWQSYPGHVPCPVPAPADLGYQWRGAEYGNSEEKARLAAIESARRMLRMKKFPGTLLSRLHVHAALWLTKLGIRDYAYAIRDAEVFCRYWESSCGTLASTE